MSSHEHGAGDCEDIFARLSEYVDDELAEEIRTRIDGHMEDCEPCVAFLESLRRTVRWVQAEPTPPLADDVREEVCRAYRRMLEQGAED